MHVAVFVLVRVSFSRFIRHTLDTRLSKFHRYHSYNPEVKRRISTQPSTLLVRPLLIYYALPLLKTFVGVISTQPDAILRWSPEDVERLDLERVVAVFASMYLFDIAHHQSTLPYFIHHLVSLAFALATITLGRGPSQVIMSLFFAPFLAPGMAFGDTCGEASWLAYRLAPYRRSGQASVYGALLAACARVHAAARLLLWALIARYLWCFSAQVAAAAGVRAVPALAAALAYWGWCEWFYVRLGFRLQEKWEKESADCARMLAVRCPAKGMI